MTTTDDCTPAVFLRPGQMYVKGRALAGLRLDADTSVMPLEHPGDDRKAKPFAGNGIIRIQTVEYLKHLVMVFSGNANTVVVHLIDHPVILEFSGNADRTRPIEVQILQSVIDEISENLADLVFIAQTIRKIGHLKGYAFCLDLECN